MGYRGITEGRKVVKCRIPQLNNSTLFYFNIIYYGLANIGMIQWFIKEINKWHLQMQLLLLLQRVN